MLDSSAIEKIAQLGRAEWGNHLQPAGTATVVLEEGQRIESIEKHMPHRDRYRGTFATTSLPAFAEHVAHARNTVLGDGAPKLQGFVDTDKMVATVFFNLGDAKSPGHGDHLARLNLKQSAAYAALLGAVQRPHDQRSLHDFVEDWRELIVPIYAGTPDPNKLAQALAAIRDITVETARTVVSEVRDMGATASALERVDATSRQTLPSGFAFTCVPYDGLGSRTFQLRLGVNTGGDKLSLSLRIQQAEKVTEQIAQEVRDVLASALDTHAMLTLGTFTP